MDNRDRSPARKRGAFACCLLVLLVAAACAKTGVKIASKATVAAATGTFATTTMPPSTDPSSTDPSGADMPTTAPTLTAPLTTAPAVTAPPVTAARKWVPVAQFSASGDKESDTFTITGAPARVTYKASDQFLLNIDTGDPADDTPIGSCPAGGCTRQGTVLVAPGGWYLHVTAPSPATAFSVTLEEYR
jgi:hypothetical protein